MNTKQEKALKLAAAIEQQSKELQTLLASDSTLKADERLEYTRKFLQKCIQPILDHSLRSGNGHKGGYRTPLQGIDNLISRLLTDLDDWEIRGIPPESIQQSAQIEKADQNTVPRSQEIESLLQAYHDHANASAGSTDAALDKLNEQYEKLFNN